MKSGADFGWSIMEGSTEFNGPEPDGHVRPLYSYRHEGISHRCSVIGGVVVRGGRLPNLEGTYLFSDYCDGVIRSLRHGEEGEVDILDLTTGALAGGNTPQASKKQTLVITARVTTLGSESITVEQADGSQPAITTSSAHGVYEHQGQGLQIDGLGIITSTQNPTNWGDQNAQYGAIDRASADNDFWKGNQQDAQDSAGNNGVLSIQEHIQPLHNTIRTRRGQFAGNQKRLLALLGNSQDTILKNQMLHDMRTTGIRRRLKGGNWEGVEFDQTVFVLDVTAPTDKIRFLDAEATYRYIMREFYFDTKPGSQWERATDSVSSRPIERYRTYVLGRQQLLTTSCLAQGEIVNLAT